VIWVVCLGLPLAFLAVFFFGPLAWMVLLSLSVQTSGHGPQLVYTLANFARLLTDPFYLRNTVWLTLKLALASTALALVIGYPIAYVISEAPPRWRGVLITLVIVPLWVNVVIRIFGWGVILMDHGVLNTFLVRLGMIARPVRIMFTQVGVLIGLTQIAVPYVVVPLIGVLTAIDRSLLDAAHSVGAGRWRAFWKVTFPLSIPGVAAGTLIVFSLNASAFAIPAMMGGGRVRMMGLMAFEQAATLGNFPYAAAIGITLLVLSLACVAAYTTLLTRAFGGAR
jgi:putative spermidine/putrescine transport system permease protein